jgi:hypothetical protein
MCGAITLQTPVQVGLGFFICLCGGMVDTAVLGTALGNWVKVRVLSEVHGWVRQLVDLLDLKSSACGFESHPDHILL